MFKRLRIWQNISLHSVILHSKITRITPERPQITPDHTRSSQNHAFWTYFLHWASPNNFFSVSHSPPQPRETAHTSNGPTVTVFCFKSEKKTYQWSQIGKIDPKDHRNKGVSYEPMNLYGQWDKTCTTRVVPFSVGEYTFWKKQALCITSSNIVDHGEFYYSANCCSLTVILAIWNHPQHLSTRACQLLSAAQHS